MGAALEKFKSHSEQVLEALRSEATTEILSDLLAEREGRIEAVIAAARAGEKVLPQEIEALEEQERQVIEALQIRRDEVCQEMASLRRGRSAGSAYRPELREVSRYVDREG